MAKSPQQTVNEWITKFEIAKVIDAENEEGLTPVDLGWDSKCVWTCWDSYDEVGAYVTPGYDEKVDVEGEQFVASWFLGSKNWTTASPDVVVIDRETCDACDTEGCDDCEGLGWVETDYLLGAPWEPDVYPPAEGTPRASFCSNCGYKFEPNPSFCGGCGKKI